MEHYAEWIEHFTNEIQNIKIVDDVSKHIEDFTNGIRDVKIVDDAPFYYEKSPPRNENNNYYHFKNINYDYDKCKTTFLNMTYDDLKVEGSYIFVYTPLKRKLNKCDLNIKKNKNTGRNVYNYNKTYSNVFYINNKLKITENITNRFVVFNKLSFYSMRNGNSIDICDDTNYEIRIESIIESYSKISKRVMPVHVYTSNPVICELMAFIISNYLRQNIFTHIPQECYNKYRNVFQIVIYYIKNLQSVHHIQSTEKYRVKTRSCVITTEKNMDVDDEDSSPSPLYTFNDQSIVIVDNNYNDLKPPKIIVNISKKSSNYHDIRQFFINPNDKIWDDFQTTCKFFKCKR